MLKSTSRHIRTINNKQIKVEKYTLEDTPEEKGNFH